MCYFDIENEEIQKLLKFIVLILICIFYKFNIYYIKLLRNVIVLNNRQLKYYFVI